MEINYTKTKFLEFHPEDKNPLASEIIEDETSEIEFELNYKYLGVELNICERQSIFQEFYKTRLARAQRYAGSIKSLAAKSHDPIEVAETLWLKTAIPSILYGCEVAGFTEKSISDLESVQANIGAFILGVSKFSAHIGILNELGWPSIRSNIYERKLNYFHRVKNLEEKMLVHKAMMECCQLEQPITFNNSVGGTMKRFWKSKYRLEIQEMFELYEVPVLP